MRLLSWDKLPQNMQNEQVRRYYEHLANQRFSLFLKRSFDLFFAIILLIFMLPLFLVIAIAIPTDSKGSIFFRQTRITQYGREFKIFKFRTMVKDAEKIGAQVTVKSDPRITKVGRFLRNHRLDEYPQLLNIITGDMTFVGTRPEVPKYVAAYTDEMLATLLLPAGVTSEASIQYKAEAQLLEEAENADCVYIEKILMEKMVFNLAGVKNYSIISDIRIILKTIFIILGL